MKREKRLLAVEVKIPGAAPRYRVRRRSVDASPAAPDQRGSSSPAAFSAAKEAAARTLLLRDGNQKGGLNAMQTFTPELVVRLQNLQDRVALQEWDTAAERYVSALQQVLPQFPSSLRKFAGDAILHDAEVLSISQSRDNLSITLQPELEEDHLLILSYTLVEDPRLNTGVFSEQYRTETSAWLYDEFSLGEPMTRLAAWCRRRATQQNGRVPVYCHDILWSNGWELLLRFRQFKVTRPRRLLPAPRTADAAGKLSQSA